jgi:hypothetical protein
LQLFTDGLPPGQPGVSELFASDILHQGIKGAFFDHYVTWVSDIIKKRYGKDAKQVMDEIDRRFVLRTNIF